MFYEKRLSVPKLFLIFVIFSAASPAYAQQLRANDSWLDRPLVNWNRRAGSFPRLPRPPAPDAEAAITPRCRQQVRRPASAAERAVVRRGWTLYAPPQTSGTTKVILAMAGVDGMCRPLSFQAFVYSEGRYAGTLSPLRMDSRTDGALTNVRLTSPTRITAEFVRYKESDPLCCPSRISTVRYSMGRDEVPELVPDDVTTRATSPASDVSDSNSDTTAASLFGKRWTLTEMGERSFSADEPYIEFDREQGGFSGSSGCNRISGRAEINEARLRLTRIISTKRGCPGEAQRIETSFLRLLEETTRFDVRGDTLRLYANDRPILTFVSR